MDRIDVASKFQQCRFKREFVPTCISDITVHVFEIDTMTFQISYIPLKERIEIKFNQAY